MDDLISRHKILDFCNQVINRNVDGDDTNIVVEAFKAFKAYVNSIPSAQPEIIRCNSCKHWAQTIGEMRGFGLGACDFHNAEYVTCNGFCYWAERREQNG